MLRKILLGLAFSLFAAAAYADASCDTDLMARYRHSQTIADSLRPDKGAQVRVFASDGSVFTAGQAQWMQGQLRSYERLCAHATDVDRAEAAKVLAGVEELLRSHRPRP